MKHLRPAPPADLLRLPAERLRDVARQPAPLVCIARAIAALIMRALLRVYCRFEIVGEEHLRSNRSFVLVANHSSHLDTVCLLSALPLRRLHHAFPAAAADYFFKNGRRTWFATVFMNALPFARQAHARHSLAACAQLLERAGNVLIIFPEGTRSASGQLQDFKCGIGALLAGRDINALPCFIDGASRAWPKGRRIPRPRKVRLIIGQPRNFGGRPADKAVAATVAAELHHVISDLAQQHGAR
ncbi:MAG: lysophospholipid acyltransferase family protein [Chthoniobacterales bacterium]